MPDCIFVTDLHGKLDKYKKLIEYIASEKPSIVFIGGDLLPSSTIHFSKSGNAFHHFIIDFLIPEFSLLKQKLNTSYPYIYLILGNDDPRCDEPDIIKGEELNLWAYINMKSIQHGDFTIIGYQYVPPTPFHLKDWEKYDVSRYVDPGCISPEEGRRTVKIIESRIKYETIKDDLDKLTKDVNFDKTIFLFHSPPYKTKLDRAALDGKMIDYVPLDVHVGSIAIKKLIAAQQPLITMHGHVHESTRLTGSWNDTSGKTVMFNAAHDGSELSIIAFNLESPGNAERKLI